jgi:hypothetical protein
LRFYGVNGLGMRFIVGKYAIKAGKFARLVCKNTRLLDNIFNFGQQKGQQFLE